MLGFHGRGAAELAGPDAGGAVGESAAVGGGGERGVGLIELAAKIADFIEVILVRIPVAERDFDQLEEQIERREDEDEAGDDADGLCRQLRGIAVEQPPHRPGQTVPAVAVSAVGEQAERQHPPGAADPVDRDGADRIVDFQRPLDEVSGDDDEDAGEAADDRGNDGDPAVLPVRRPLAGNRQDGVGDARTEIARRIERIPRRPAERESDAEDEDADEQRLQAAAEDERQVDVTGL